MLKRVAVLFLCLLIFTSSSFAQPEHMPYSSSLSIIYSRLSEKDKAFVDDLYDAIWEGKSTVKAPSGFSKERISELLGFVYFEFPELTTFFYSRTGIGADKTIYLKYRHSASERRSFLKRMKHTAQSVSGGTDETKSLRAIYNYLAARLSYVQTEDLDSLYDTPRDPSYAYTVSKTGQAVCSGYASMFVLLCHLAGYRCSYIINQWPQATHATNIIRADGKYGYVDVTWGDTGNEGSDEHFGMSQAALEKDRPIQSWYRRKVPKASGIKFSNWCYRTHIQTYGWLRKCDWGETSGKPGEGLRIEALEIHYPGIRYKAHVEGIGWQPWVSSGQVAGTTGEGRRMEAFKIKLTGSGAKNNDILYRAWVEGRGWTKWIRNGGTCGTTGKSLRLEAIEIKIVRKK